MQIEIVTTKKKLSKSLINQMQSATVPAMQEGTVLGYIINANKYNYKTILVEYDGRYYTAPHNWTKGDTSVYRRIGKYSTSKKFSSALDCDNWWRAYQKIVKSAVTQIYI